MLSRAEYDVLPKEEKRKYSISMPLPLRYFYKHDDSVSKAIEIVGEEKYRELLEADVLVVGWDSWKSKK